MMPSPGGSQPLLNEVLPNAYRRFTLRLRSAPPDGFAVSADDVLAVGDDEVALAGATADLVADTVPGLEPVVSSAAREVVAAQSADEAIIAGATEEPVVAGAAEEPVVAAEATSR